MGTTPNWLSSMTSNLSAAQQALLSANQGASATAVGSSALSASNLGVGGSGASSSGASSSGATSAPMTAASSASLVGTTYANGATIVEICDNGTETFMKAQNANGKVFYVNNDVNIEDIPADIIAGLSTTNTTKVSVFAQFDTPRSGSSVSNFLNGVIYPDGVPHSSLQFIVQENPGTAAPDTDNWYSYIQQNSNGFFYSKKNASGVTPMPGTVSHPPGGRGYLFGMSGMQTINFPGGTVLSQIFNTLLEAQNYLTANPGGTIDYDVETQTNILPNDLAGWLAQGWVQDGPPVQGTATVVPGTENTKEGSALYNQYFGQPGYEWVSDYIVPGEVIRAKQNWDDITESELKLLKEQYPGELIIKAGTPITTGTTLTKDDIREDSAQFQELIADGWTKKFSHTINVGGDPTYQYENNITYDELLALQAQNPNWVGTPNGNFGDPIITYKTETKDNLTAEQVANLPADQNWTVTLDPDGSTYTVTSTQVVTQDDITQAEADALDDSWTVNYSHSEYETITTNGFKTKEVNGVSDLSQYENRPGFEIKNTFVGESTIEEWKVDNKSEGILAYLIDAGDGEGQGLTVGGLQSEYEDSSNQVGSLFSHDTALNPSDMFLDDCDAPCDTTDSALIAGDPFYKDMGDPWNGGVEDDLNGVEFHPNANIYKALTGGNSKFNFSLNQMLDEINDDLSVANVGYGYFFDIEGEAYTLGIVAGQATLTDSNGVATVIDPDQGLILPAGASADDALVVVEKVSVPGAGFNGAAEDRLSVTVKELASDSVVQELLDKGFSQAEIDEKTTVTHTNTYGFRIPLADADQAYGPHSAGTSSAIHQTDDGAGTYYDMHYIKDVPCEKFTKETPGETTYDICYDEPCSETETIEHKFYDATKTEEVGEEKPHYVATRQIECEEPVPLYDAKLEVPCDKTVDVYDFCKDVTETTETFDVCLPEIVGEDCAYGYFLETSETFNIKKETWQVENTTGNKTAKSANFKSSSPLALDLDGDGVTTSSDTWDFDLDGDGTIETLNASLDFGDGWLVYDKNGDGLMNDGTEMFGNVTNGGTYADGLEALRDFAETNLVGSTADGVLDINELTTLEANFNLRIQVTDPQGNPQLVAPSTLGVTQIKVYPDPDKPPFIENDVVHNPRTSFERNNEWFDLNDVWFYQVSNQQAAQTGNTATGQTGNTATAQTGNTATAAAQNQTQSSANTANTNVNQQSAANANNQAAMQMAMMKAMAELFAPQQQVQNNSQQYNSNAGADMLGYMGLSANNPAMGMMQNPASFQQQMSSLINVVYLLAMMNAMFSGGGFNPFMSMMGNQPQNNS